MWSASTNTPFPGIPAASAATHLSVLPLSSSSCALGWNESSCISGRKVFAFGCRSRSAAARAEGRSMQGECVEHGVAGAAPSQAHSTFRARRGCTGPLVVPAWSDGSGHTPPSVHACTECPGTGLPPACGWSGCLRGTTWHQEHCHSCGGIRRLVPVPNILVPPFFLVQNFLMEKRSIPKGSSSAQICDLCAA